MMAFKPSSPPWCVASPVGAVYTLSTKAEVSKLATGDVVGLPRASNFNVMLGIVKSEDGKPGGDTDKVNARHKDGLTPEECEAACDAIPVDSSDGICAGYATKDSGTLDCILYGPGMAGACAALNQDQLSPDDCAAVGTCADASPCSLSMHVGVFCAALSLMVVRKREWEPGFSSGIGTRGNPGRLRRSSKRPKTKRNAPRFSSLPRIFFRSAKKPKRPWPLFPCCRCS